MDYGLVIVIHTIDAQDLRYKRWYVSDAFRYDYVRLCSNFKRKPLMVLLKIIICHRSLFDQEYFLSAMCENFWYNRIYTLCIVMRQFDFALICKLQANLRETTTTLQSVSRTKTEYRIIRKHECKHICTSKIRSQIQYTWWHRCLKRLSRAHWILMDCFNRKALSWMHYYQCWS